MLPTLWLSCHVHYACRHRGVCCTSGWPLPVEDTVVSAIDDAVARGRLTTSDGHTAWRLESAEAAAGMAGTLRQSGRACVFHRPRAGAPAPDGASHECAVHATLGHAALPATCQHFPRVALIDDRGVRVSLSHVCPTALDLLQSHDGPVTIVHGPPAVPGRDVPEGLDARDALPPALSDRVLMDLDTLTSFEAHAVELLAGPSAPEGNADAVVATLIDQAGRLAAWRPGHTSLHEAARGLLRRPAMLRPGDHAAAPALARHARVADTCRVPWTWPSGPEDPAAADARWVAPFWDTHAMVVRRYLATRAFGAWAQYQARHLVMAAGWLDTVLSVVRVEAGRACAAAERPLDRERLAQAIREADRLLLHYAEPALTAVARP